MTKGSRPARSPYNGASTPDELGKFIAENTDKWSKVIRTAGIKAE